MVFKKKFAANICEIRNSMYIIYYVEEKLVLKLY